MTRSALFLSACLGLFAGPGGAEIVWQARTHVVGGSCAEIGAWAQAQQVLIATNDADETIDLYRVDQLTTNPTIAGVQRIDVEDTKPTSAAVHPTRPMTLVTALCDGHEYPGELYLVSLEGKPGQASGKIIHRQPLPPGPDSIAITPDGRLAMIAIEAEEDPATPGRLLLVDLTDMDAHLQARRDLPVREIPGLDKALGIPVGRIEPEFIAISPDSKLAAVSCQENDAVLLVELPAGRIAGVIRLQACANPDGVAVTGPLKHHGRSGYLVVAAEEGRKDPMTNIRGGQTVSVHFAPADALHAPQPLARFDVRKPLLLSKGKRCDPEGLVLLQLGSRLLCAVGLERRQKALLLDLSEPTLPRCLHVIDVGVRPEGLFAVPVTPSHAVVVVVNEGTGREGSLTFVDLKEKTQ